MLKRKLKSENVTIIISLRSFLFFPVYKVVAVEEELKYVPSLAK